LDELVLGYRYLYDGNGERVEKCVAATSTTACPTSGTNGTLYWKGPGSNTLSETDLSGNVLNTYIFFNGQRIARNDSAGAIHYYFSDHLGSHGVVENATGSVCEQDIDYYPYGGVQYDYCHNAPQNYKFTGKERDAESGLDNFGARYYGSSLGRFMQTDPIWVKADRMLDPQRLNLYSYVRNNPLTLTDPSGMDVVLRTCSGSSTMTQCFNQVQNGLKKEDRSHVHLVEGDGKNGFKKGQYGITVDADYKGSAGNFSTLQKLANDHSATANVDVLKPTDSFNVRISVSYNAKSGLGNLSTSSMTANDFEGYTFSLQGRTRRNRSLLTKTRMS
jgi:RHS repeat-associated protein